MKKRSMAGWRAILLQIRLVVLDVDGVLTDGVKYYNGEGLASLSFHTRDGLGIYMLHRAGFKLAFITNGQSNIVRARAVDLGITDLLEGVQDKRSALRQLKERLEIKTEETLYMGDDLWDLAAFEEASIRITVADAPLRVRRAADWVTQNSGGRGAVREVADVLLKARRIDVLTLLDEKGVDKCPSICEPRK